MHCFGPIGSSRETYGERPVDWHPEVTQKSMNASTLRRALFRLRNTPLHPQWFAFRQQSSTLGTLMREFNGLVLDIGCADQQIRRFLPVTSRYVGMDYYQTAANWYKTVPHVYGDAQALPFASSSADHILLLDVLEHLPRPENCVAEINRVLKRGGKLVMQAPFVYPIHDAPLDFQRWTALLHESRHQNP
jgi:SAM-dependent methyltransferase